MTVQVTIRPDPFRVRLLATCDGDDCLKAVLPSRALHHRAVHTLLEGLALWLGQPVRAAIVAGHRSAPSHVEDLFGGRIWPDDSAMVHFEVVTPHRLRRIRGLGDFRPLYLVHGRAT